MSGGAQSDSDGGPPDPDQPGARVWQHPNEVGLAIRGRNDRRRSTALAAGVVLGGIGLLVTGVLLGTSHRDADDADSVDTVDRVSRSIVHVTTVEDAATTLLTGLVIDDSGHVLVPADAVLSAEQIWARCNGGAAEQVEVVDSDPATNLALLRLVGHTGEPAPTEDERPRPGAEVMTVRARAGSELVVSNGTVAAEEPRRSTTAASGIEALAITPTPDAAAPASTAAADDIGGGLLFDAAGRFLGMTTTSDEPAATAGARVVELMPAEAVLVAAERLLAGD
jgi:Trypsin-like peptidase domain